MHNTVTTRETFEQLVWPVTSVPSLFVKHEHRHSVVVIGTFEMAVEIPTFSRSPCTRPDRLTLDMSATRTAFTIDLACLHEASVV